jgi:hypothetical protein
MKNKLKLLRRLLPLPHCPGDSGVFTIGLDLGDRSHCVCVLDVAGQMIHEGALLYDRVALALLLTHGRVSGRVLENGIY